MVEDPKNPSSSLLFPVGDVNALLDSGSLLLSFKEQESCAKNSSPLQDGSASTGAFLAQARVNFHSKASPDSLSHPFTQGSLPRELKKHHQLKQDATALAISFIFLADLSPEHHPRRGLLTVPGKQPWGREWDVLFGADTDLKINAHTTVKNLAENTTHSKWKKSHSPKKRPRCFS